MVLAAVAQLCSRASVEGNLRQAVSVIRRSSAAGAKLVALPEASDFIADAKTVPRLSEPIDTGTFVTGIRAAAKEYDVWVSVGVHESSPDDPARCYNTNLLISPTSIVQRYRKLHLFDVDIKGGATILESNTTIKGDRLMEPSPSPIGNIGLLTCYDLRFPEASLALRRQGASVITYPSAFTMKTGAAHWEVLLRARAIETQCYVLAAAQIGSHSSTRQSYGHALIVDPWGTVISQGADNPPPFRSAEEPADDDSGTFVLGEIDLPWLSKLRVEIPLWEQRRNDVYPVL